MKRFTQIFFIVSCTVACLLPVRMSAQCPTCNPTSTDSIDLIVILHDSVNNNPGRVNYFITQLGVRQLGMTTPSNARLWRMPKCGCALIDGVSITWDGMNGAVDKTGPRIKAVGMSENWEIVAAPTTFNEDIEPQNLNTLSKCTTNMDYSILTCPRGFEGVRVAVLDAGASSSRLISRIQSYIHKGWNFIDDTPNYTDDYGHGNFVSNIILTFMSRRDSFYIYKVLNNRGSGSIFDAIEAIDRCSDERVDILNISFVAALNSCISTATTPFKIAIDSARVRNILCIVAAGNDNATIDNFSFFNNLYTDHYTPAAEPNDNIITVISNDCCGNKSTFSNYGVNNADISALGEDVLSYWLNDVLQRRSGTSYATPIVSGVAVLLYSNILRSRRNYTILKDAILQGAGFSANLTPYCLTSGIINAPQAFCLFTSPIPTPCVSTWSPICPILAIKEMPFIGRLYDQTVYLEWSTHQILEKNTSFIIEKSTDGRNFDEIMRIEADNRNQYAEIDKTLKSGCIYYRLLTKNSNGSMDTSQTIALNIPTSKHLMVFPNPTQTQTTIRYELSVSDKISIELVDMMGKIFPISAPQIQNKGFNEYTFDAQNFPSGIYVCRIISSRFILQKTITITP